MSKDIICGLWSQYNHVMKALLKTDMEAVAKAEKKTGITLAELYKEADWQQVSIFLTEFKKNAKELPFMAGRYGLDSIVDYWEKLNEKVSQRRNRATVRKTT